MRRFLLTLALLLPAALPAQGADFRGVWVLDAAKSDLGQMGQVLAAQGVTLGLTRTVTQTEASLTVTTTMNAAGQQQSQEQTMIVDGTPRVRPSDAGAGGETTVTARWEAGSLVVEQVLRSSRGEMTRVETWTRSADGSTLTITSVTRRPDGEMRQVFVHTKQAP